MQRLGTIRALKFIFSDSVLLVNLLKLSKPDKGQCGASKAEASRTLSGVLKLRHLNVKSGGAVWGRYMGPLGKYGT